jgi:hypothetical protein
LPEQVGLVQRAEILCADDVAVDGEAHVLAGESLVVDAEFGLAADGEAGAQRPAQAGGGPHAHDQFDAGDDRLGAGRGLAPEDVAVAQAQLRQRPIHVDDHARAGDAEVPAGRLGHDPRADQQVHDRLPGGVAVQVDLDERRLVVGKPQPHRWGPRARDTCALWLRNGRFRWPRSAVVRRCDPVDRR